MLKVGLSEDDCGVGYLCVGYLFTCQRVRVGDRRVNSRVLVGVVVFRINRACFAVFRRFHSVRDAGPEQPVENVVRCWNAVDVIFRLSRVQTERIYQVDWVVPDI